MPTVPSPRPRSKIRKELLSGNEITSRERAELILNHEEADRICIDYGGTRCSGIHYLAQKELKSHLGIDNEDNPIVDPMQQIAMPDSKLLELFHGDFYPVFAQSPDNWELEIIEEENCQWYIDEWGTKCSKPKNSYWFDPVEHPLENAESVEEVSNYSMPDPKDPGRTRGLREKIKSIRENTDYAIAIGAPTGGLFETGYWLRGWETWLIDTARNPKIVKTIVEKLVNWQMQYWDKVLDEVGDLIEVVQIGDDLGGQNSPLINPESYRSLFKEPQRKLCEKIKSKTSAKIFLHSCGEIYDFLPDIVDVGIDIINPVQVSCPKMGDTSKLNEEFGKDLVFWGGGCDVHKILPRGTTDEVEKEVIKRIKDLSPGGGFVFNAVHNIQPDVPPENIVKMYETAYKFGYY